MGEPEVCLDAVTFARTALRFLPDEKQAEVLASSAKRGILNCSRQWGKSTVAAAKAIHRAVSVPESLILVASPGERQSGEFIRKAGGLVRRLKIKPRGDGDNSISLLFPNGSRIIGLPGTEATVRGFSAVSLILIDEASRVPDEMYRALRPMLAVGDGDLWMMSTPAGQRGFFYETWAGTSGAAEEWMRVSVKGTECPRISASFLKAERGVMTEEEFAQEYLAEFHGVRSAYFDKKLIDAAVDLSVSELKIPRRR